MKSVLVQEWKARKNMIALISAALFIAAAIGMPLGSAGADSESQLPFHVGFIVLLVISVILIVGLVFFLPLLQGAGTISKDLLSDRGYLLLSLPKKPIVLFTGKMIIGLAEFLIYAVPVFFYLSFTMPLIPAISGRETETYGEMIKQIYYHFFVEDLKITVYVFFVAIAFFLFAQTVINFAVVLYRSFIRTCNAAFGVFVFVFIEVFVMLKILGLLSDTLCPIASSALSAQAASDFLPLFTGTLILFSALYFFITLWLFKHKVEI